jgi:hypothetical protein
MNRDIPPTPKPKRIDEIQEEASDRFAGVIITNKCFKILDDHFTDYDQWEEYDENKSYSKRPYQDTYKGILREYHNYLYILNDNNEKAYYVVAKRIRSELKKLEPYCTCLKCQASYFNPLRYIWCAHCTKCLKAGRGFADKSYIEKAQQLKDDKVFYLNKYKKYPYETQIMKVIEIIIFLIIFICYCYY